MKNPIIAVYLVLKMLLHTCNSSYSSRILLTFWNENEESFFIVTLRLMLHEGCYIIAAYLPNPLVPTMLFSDAKTIVELLTHEAVVLFYNLIFFHLVY